MNLNRRLFPKVTVGAGAAYARKLLQQQKIRQGVTTELLGMNAGSFVGQGTLRGEVMAMSGRAASAAEIAEMQELAAAALRQGALGISSGLEYTPGGFATGDVADRGRLAEGFFADITVFDPATVEDKATFAKPHQYAHGFEAVVVNGKLVLEGGERSEELPGDGPARRLDARGVNHGFPLPRTVI